MIFSRYSLQDAAVGGIHGFSVPLSRLTRMVFIERGGTMPVAEIHGDNPLCMVGSHLNCIAPDPRPEWKPWSWFISIHRCQAKPGF